MKKPRTRLFRTQTLAAGVLLFGAIFLVPTVTSISSAASPQAPGESATQAPLPGDEGPLVAEGEPADLAIIYTGGVVGYVEPCG